MQKIILNDGVAIPQVGFGTFQIPAGEETERAVAFALSCGCRHIDTARREKKIKAHPCAKGDI